MDKFGFFFDRAALGKLDIRPGDLMGFTARKFRRHYFRECLKREATYSPIFEWGLSNCHPRKWHWRDLIEGIFYVLKTGCQWRASPGEFARWQTVYRYFQRLELTHFWEKLNANLNELYRIKVGKKPKPTAASLDSQSVKASETGGPHGYDPGKHIKGTKRPILVDTLGLLITVVVHSAGVQD